MKCIFHHYIACYLAEITWCILFAKGMVLVNKTRVRMNVKLKL